MVIKATDAQPSIRRRAVGDRAKAARRRQLLDAALGLFVELPFAEITMAAVARRAGVAKGTTYLYFRTKEEVFLALYQDALDRWLDALGPALEDRPVDATTFAEVVTASLEARPIFCRLLALLHLVLEHNLDLHTAVTFKRWLRDRLAPTARALEAALPRLRAGDGLPFLLRLNALVVGLHQMTHPTGVVAEALDHADLRMFQRDFGDELRATLACLVRGWPTPA